MHPSLRPPIGFVVEGAGEHAAYPTLASRSIGTATGLHLPRVNAAGYGGIVANLEEHLDDLVTAHHPFGVLVALDLRDVLRGGRSRDCVTLRRDLVHRVQAWMTLRGRVPRFQPLPQTVAVVIQVQMFETWWLSDPEGLSRTGLFRIDTRECAWADVDNEVDNPAAWLQKRAIGSSNLKSPVLAKTVASRLDPSVMARQSRSFRKLKNEVTAAYAAWEAAVAQGPSS
jgi:Domain of unknown function (DUF4276)